LLGYGGTTANSAYYFGVTGASTVTYGGGNADTACMRIEDCGSNNGYYHGLEFRSKRSGDIRMYCHDQGDNLADFVLAVDDGTNIVERLRVTSGGVVNAVTGQVEANGNSAAFKTKESGGATVHMQSGGAQGYIGTETNHHLSIRTNSNIVANFTEDGDMMIMHPTNSNAGQILGMLTFSSSNTDAFQNQEDCYRINFWENARSTTSTRTENSNASIRYNASTSDGGDGAIRFANEAGTRILYMNRLGNGGTSGTWTAGSDQRKKDNIVTVPNALDTVSQLRGVNFDWKERYGGFADSGVIAQEVESVLPHLVITQDGARDKDDDGNVVNMKNMNYNGLWGVMIEAVKELKEKNAALEARLAALEG